MVEVVESGEDFAVLKSPASGRLYAVVFEVKRKGEVATIAPLARFLSRGATVMTAGAADVPAPEAAAQPAVKTPAGRPASVQRAKPGETTAKVEAQLSAEWQEIKAIAAAAGLGSGGGVRSALDILVDAGRVEVKQVARDPDHPNGLKKNLYRYANEPIGPVSQRESEPSQASS